MAVLNKRAVVSAIEMFGRSSIRLPKVLVESFDALIKSLFANNEQGFFYDPNDLSTMFQNSAGTIPVTAAGQPVGLMLDKSKGLTLGSEIILNGEFNTTDNWTFSGNVRIENGELVFTNASAAYSRQTISIVSGRTYQIVIGGFSVTSGFLGVRVGAEDVGGFFNSNGDFNVVYVAKSSGSISFDIRCSTSTTNASVEFVSVRELRGNHAYQTTSSMRPRLVASPQRLDYDTADDKLITTLPAQLTGCTVIRSVPNVGTQILTGQTIPTPYNDNADHCGLIVINRALTPSETSQITKLFNKAAGM